MATFSSLGKYKDFGLLVMRSGLGFMFILHGYPKLMGGPERWEKVGAAIAEIGISFYPAGWGLAAALAETIGGILMILGFQFRPVAILLVFTMLIAALRHLGPEQSIMAASHPIEVGFAVLGLVFLGPGKYSIDKR